MDPKPQHWRGIAIGAVVYALAMGILSSWKPAWLDETLFVEVARLPSFAQIWDSLARYPVNADPPAGHLLIRPWIGLFGETVSIARIPSIVAFGILCLCVFRIIQGRLGNRWGMAAVAALFCTPAWPFAVEARPYAPMLASSGMALFIWDRIKRGATRGYVGLAVSIALTLSFSFTGVLILIPLLLPEAAEWTQRRRFNAKLVWASVIGALPIIVWIPIMAGQGSFKAGYFSKPNAFSLVVFFYQFLPIAFATALLAIRAPKTSSHPPEQAVDGDSFGWMILGFAVLPIVAFGMGLFVTGTFVSRHVLQASIGFALGAPWLLWRLGGAEPNRGWHATALYSAAAVLSFVFLPFSMQRQMFSIGLAKHEAEEATRIIRNLKQTVVWDSPLTFLPAYYELAPDARAKLMYLYDPAREKDIAGYDTSDLIYQNLAKFPTRIQLVAFDEFLKNSPADFYLLTRPSKLQAGNGTWLLSALNRMGATVTNLGGERVRLVRVHLPVQ